VIAIVIAVVVVAAVVLALIPIFRRRRLRGKFGPEYDRVVETTDDRRTAEHELAERERRHAGFDLQELSADQKEQYTTQWTEVQEQFVDNPTEAVTAADQLVTAIMSERGYPTDGYEQQLADLSVEHAKTLDHYRAAHDIATRPTDTQVSTEDMRTAIVHYRELFQDLIVTETPNKHNKKDAMS
jgi:hypothetical protein